MLHNIGQNPESMRHFLQQVLHCIPPSMDGRILSTILTNLKHLYLHQPPPLSQFTQQHYFHKNHSSFLIFCFKNARNVYGGWQLATYRPYWIFLHTAWLPQLSNALLRYACNLHFCWIKNIPCTGNLPQNKFHFDKGFNILQLNCHNHYAQ